jgi:ABC-2 type transport system permease protein
MSYGSGSRRLWGLIRKEALQILRDPSSIGIAFVLPILLLLLFGYGVSLDAEHVPVAIVVDHPSDLTQDFASSFFESDFFEPVMIEGIDQAEEAMMHRRVDGIIWIRSDFSKRLLSSAVAPVGLILNGVDANKARIIDGYVQGAWAKWAKRRKEALGLTSPAGVDVEYRIWFNSAVKSRNFLVPGLLAVIMTLTGGMLTALVVAREWERGTMEALIATPVTKRQILAGKVIPYFVLGMMGMVLTVFMTIEVFDVPFRGSFWALAISSSLFMLSSIFMGLIISIGAGSQFVAGQIAIVITFLPAFILSGFIFDIGSMPLPIQFITYIIPARHFVSILQSIFLAGDIWPVIRDGCLWLVLLNLVFLGIITRKFRKRLA